MNSLQSLFAGAALAAVTAFPATAQTRDVDTVLAVVNGTEITLGHVIALRQELPQSYDQYAAEDLYPALLEQLITQTALAPTVDTDTKRMRLKMENQRRSVLAVEAIDEVARSIPEEAVRAEYEKQYVNAPAPVEYNASHILVETEEEAQAIAEEIRAGADFAETAKAKSTGPSGPSGGELGWFGKGRMVPAFEDAVVKMEVGQVSDPVQTEFGWHVIKLNEMRDLPPPSYETMAGSIRRTLTEEATEALVQSVNDAADIVRTEAEVDMNALNNPELLDE
ncbi:MAG: peptidylprolyl isomerase [Brevirhabdus sp.]